MCERETAMKIGGQVRIGNLWTYEASRNSASRIYAPIMPQNIIDVNTFYSFCFQGERRWYQVGVG